MSGLSHLERATTEIAFEAKYRKAPDPWGFASSSYERDRYRRILSALTRSHYHAAFEPGCSIGELTALLAPRCDSLLATDISQTAAERATRRCAQFSGVTIRREALSIDTIPAGEFDLIVFSEVGYYFAAADLNAIAFALRERLSVEGELVAAHWLGNSPDHVLHGDVVHEVLLRAPGMRHVLRQRFEGFRIDSWKKT